MVADQIKGDTLHHNYGINDYSRSAESAEANSQKAERLSQQRWLFIDEISQVNAELLAKVDSKARMLIQDEGTYRVCPSTANVRDFGGINVVYVGDFLQLPPPGISGTPLTDIPDRVLQCNTTNATVQAGLNLLWDTDTMVELTQQVRINEGDRWWLEVAMSPRLLKRP